MVETSYALRIESNYEYSKFGFCTSLITCVICDCLSENLPSSQLLVF